MVAFLSRHGRGHSVAPQQINYRANLWALKSLGVEAVISSAAVGGLVSSHGTGTFAVPDQVLDKTWGRADTFYDGSLPTGVQHLPAAEPTAPAAGGTHRRLGAPERRLRWGGHRGRHQWSAILHQGRVRGLG
ncbi:S-methyl-5'-thioadenosine phosphorylase [Arthrobacter sp. Hiyo8]|nr:S-methyl-5'-thioadenosine phosphorylase [Arthrobacter sp. Hiyo8]